jgi:CheY-like chemotaxis protein
MSTLSGLDRNGSAHILLVDDNKGGLGARKAILEELGHCVTTASGGEDALEHFSRAKFDLVITDHRMARMNGVELIRRIRGTHPDIPVIMLSGYVEALGLTESNTGADLVLAKNSTEVTHLIRGVSRLLRQRAAKKPPKSQRPASSAVRKTS